VAAAVDPFDAAKVYEAARAQGVAIELILTTHSHFDHAGGNRALVELIQSREGRSIPVVGGPGKGVVEAATREVTTGDAVAVGSLSVAVLFTPCHTRDHVLYLCQDALFTGDTLFIAGCGRFFSAKLPAETKIYCGHEYTASNLRFAAHVEPENAAVQQKLAWALRQTAAQEYTIPSTVAEELETNPFMRVDQPAVRAFAKSDDPVAVMGALRFAKDNFVVGNNL